VQREMEGRSRRLILVLGVGNLLLGDEGVGIHAVRELEKRALPPQVDVVDGGTAGLNLLDLMKGYERVIIVDAVDAGEEPGTILRFTPQEVASDAQALPLSLHQTEILKVLELATYLGRPLPPIIIYGIQPQAMDWSTELSPALQARLSKLVDAILREMA
jgi:hydrogenase maturation protease